MTYGQFFVTACEKWPKMKYGKHFDGLRKWVIENGLEREDYSGMDLESIIQYVKDHEIDKDEEIKSEALKRFFELYDL